MAVNGFAVDFLDNVGEELGNILIGRPVDGHAQLVAVDFLKFFLEIRTFEPVVTEPVEVGELLVRKLIELSVRTGGEGFAHEIVNVQRRQGHVFSLARHEIAQGYNKAVAHMGADEVGIIHPAIIDVFTGGPLGLELFDHIPFLNQVKRDFYAGNLFKGLGENFCLIFVGGNGLGDDLDIHPLKGFGRVYKPFHFFHLLVFG